MAQHPYAQPLGALNQIITHLRNSWIQSVDASVLKKLNIAPNNESYIVNTLRALRIIDDKGKTVGSTQEVFLKADGDFQTGFSELVAVAYSDLFDLHSNNAWHLEKPQLVSFFRTQDKSSALVGGRQAETFIRLAELSGKREPTAVTRTTSNAPRAPKKPSTPSTRKPPPVTASSAAKSDVSSTEVALSVKVEVNLPATTDQAVYDAIFASVRQHLIDRD